MTTRPYQTIIDVAVPRLTVVDDLLSAAVRFRRYPAVLVLIIRIGHRPEVYR